MWKVLLLTSLCPEGYTTVLRIGDRRRLWGKRCLRYYRQQTDDDLQTSYTGGTRRSYSKTELTWSQEGWWYRNNSPRCCWVLPLAKLICLYIETLGVLQMLLHAHTTKVSAGQLSRLWISATPRLRSVAVQSGPSSEAIGTKVGD